MNKKIKIALCLSGEPRSSMASFPYIYENLINLGSQYHVDVYIHTWKGFRALKLYNPKIYQIEFLNEEKFFHEISTQLSKQNTSLEFSSFYQNYHNFSVNSNNIKNFLLMLYSINKCFNNIKESYDIIIRSRFDILFKYPLNIEPYIQGILNDSFDIALSKMTVINGTQKGKEAFDDQFSIGNYKAMKIYSDTFNNLNYLINKTNDLSVTSWIKEQLTSFNLKINFITPLIEIIRKSNIITNNQTGDFIYLDE